MIRLLGTVFSLLLLSTSMVIAKGLISFEDKNTTLYGFKDAKGKVVLKPQFTHVMPAGKGESLTTVLKDGKWYRMDEKGKMKFEAKFFDNGPDYYEQGLARFIKDGKTGFHDKKGKVVIETVYDIATPFRDGVSKVCIGCTIRYDKNGHEETEGGKWGVINLQGKVVVPIGYPTLDEALKHLK